MRGCQSRHCRVTGRPLQCRPSECDGIRAHSRRRPRRALKMPFGPLARVVTGLGSHAALSSPRQAQAAQPKGVLSASAPRRRRGGARRHASPAAVRPRRKTRCLGEGGALGAALQVRLSRGVSVAGLSESRLLRISGRAPTACPQGGGCGIRAAAAGFRAAAGRGREIGRNAAQRREGQARAASDLRRSSPRPCRRRRRVAAVRGAVPVGSSLRASKGRDSRLRPAPRLRSGPKIKLIIMIVGPLECTMTAGAGNQKQKHILGRLSLPARHSVSWPQNQPFQENTTPSPPSLPKKIQLSAHRLQHPPLAGPWGIWRRHNRHPALLEK